MNYIHLKHYHTDVQRFDHPLLDDAKVVSEDKLNEMAETVLAGGSSDELALALRRTVSLLVGRYLANWPATAPFLDDMVSEGLTEIVWLCRDIPLDLFKIRGILVIATSRAQNGIEKMLNRVVGLAAPSTYTQMDRMKKGKDPIYLESVSVDFHDQDEDTGFCDSLHPSDGGHSDLRDVLEAVCKIEAKDDIDAYLLAEENWGRSYTEMAADLGVSIVCIHRRKKQLYSRYLELTE
jgi:hypothetical protein